MKKLFFKEKFNKIRNTAFSMIAITTLLVLPLGFWGDIYPQLTLVKGTYAVTGQTAEWEALSTNEKQRRIINVEGGRVEIKSGLFEHIKGELKAAGRKSE